MSLPRSRAVYKIAYQLVCLDSIFVRAEDLLAPKASLYHVNECGKFGVERIVLLSR